MNSVPVFEDVATAVVRALPAAGVRGLVSAYMFGSVPEGRAHRESDVDVGVLLNPADHATTRQRFEVRVHLASVLPSALGGRSVDVVILNDAPPLLGRHIVCKGRRIFCADTASDHAYVRDVQLRAADLEPFLRRMRQLKLAVLAR